MASRRDLVGALGALLRTIHKADNVGQIRAGSVYALAQRMYDSAQAGSIQSVPWTTFVQVPHGTPSDREVKALAERTGKPIEEIQAEFDRILSEETLWLNSRYQVNVRELSDNGKHLSIKRIDQEIAHDWRDFQQIKNQLLGPECEAVELYPAESRRVDTANQYHLWGSTDPTFRFGFGFEERAVTSDSGSHFQRPVSD